jgi:hypothetical protein
MSEPKRQQEEAEQLPNTNKIQHQKIIILRSVQWTIQIKCIFYKANRFVSISQIHVDVSK